MSTTEEIVAAIEQAGEDYARFIEVQSPEAFHRRPAPEEWTAAELTGHVAEFPVTFSEQARRVSESPGPQLGRSLDDPGRLAAVEKLAGAGPVEAAAAVRGGLRPAARSRTSSPGPSARGRPGSTRSGSTTPTSSATRSPTPRRSPPRCATSASRWARSTPSPATPWCWR